MIDIKLVNIIIKKCSADKGLLELINLIKEAESNIYPQNKGCVPKKNIPSTLEQDYIEFSFGNTICKRDNEEVYLIYTEDLWNYLYYKIHGKLLFED